MTRVALINPNWTFDGSIYFGCRSPHLPLELGISQHLSAAGRACHAAARRPHVRPVAVRHRGRARRLPARHDRADDGADLSVLALRAARAARAAAARADRCAGSAAILVAVGPHGSTTPRMTLRKLGVDFVVMGECEEALLRLANGERDFAGLCFADATGAIHVNGGPQAAAFVDQPALQWPDEMIRRHHHHHHRFEATPVGPGAEVEASRGCPYHCTFCAKDNFRNAYRKRPPCHDPRRGRPSARAGRRIHLFHR